MSRGWMLGLRPEVGLHQPADLSSQPSPSPRGESCVQGWTPERATIPANVESTLQCRRAGSSPQTSDRLSAPQLRPAGAGDHSCTMAAMCRIAIFCPGHWPLCIDTGTRGLWACSWPDMYDSVLSSRGKKL